MIKKTTNTSLIVSIILLLCFNLPLHSAVFTSTQSGYFSAGTTWVGGLAPGPGDDIIIASGHTVTLDAAAAPYGFVQVFNITIQNGAILDNDIIPLKIDRITIGNPVYTNNGVHNGTGNLILYDNGNTIIDGNGVTNCDIEVESFGLQILNSCNLTVNANIQHSVPGNSGMSGKYLIECTQVGSNLIINGNIVTDDQYNVAITIVAGSVITVNGNVSLPGGLESGSGSLIENAGTFNISGNLVLGPYSGFCQNSGNMVIGGNLNGAFDTYFIQEINASVKFGGSVFSAGDGYLFASLSPLLGPSEPNTIEYNGNSIAQSITVPADAAYSNLVIGNSTATATISTGITVNGSLTINPGSALTVDNDGTLTVYGTLTLLSDATGTGSLIQNASGTTGFIQRYIPGHNGADYDGWHFLSSPVASQAISAFHTAGSGNDFYKWDEPTDTWINRTAEGGALNGDFETAFIAGTGYLIANIATDVKEFTGVFNISNIGISNLTYTVPSTHTGWHLLGNPFSSALTWNDGNWSLNNVDSHCQIWSEVNASYTVISNNGIIPSMNGFMVHAAVANGSLTIPAASRVHNNAAWYKNEPSQDRILLTAIDPERGTAQPSIICFNPNASEGYDSEYDSYFLAGFAPQFYSRNGSSDYALNTLPALSDELTIPISFIKNNSNYFIIELTENIPGEEIYLVDIKTNQTQKLNDGNYEFISEEGDDPDRFILHFGYLGIDDVPGVKNPKIWYSNGHVYISNEGMTGDVTINDLQGRPVMNRRIGSGGLINLPVNLPAGMYIVTIKDLSHSSSQKIFVQ